MTLPAIERLFQIGNRLLRMQRQLIKLPYQDGLPDPFRSLLSNPMIQLSEALEPLCNWALAVEGVEEQTVERRRGEGAIKPLTPFPSPQPASLREGGGARGRVTSHHSPLTTHHSPLTLHVPLKPRRCISQWIPLKR